MCRADPRRRETLLAGGEPKGFDEILTEAEKRIDETGIEVQYEDPMSKGELMDTGTDKRYVQRDKQGPCKESDDVGHSRSGCRAKSKNDCTCGI
jgi:hypothetical protein